jgi:hypothetical protein
MSKENNVNNIENWIFKFSFPNISCFFIVWSKLVVICKEIARYFCLDKLKNNYKLTIILMLFCFVTLKTTKML